MSERQPYRLSLLLMAAIYSLIFLSNGTLLMSPALSTISQAFPAEPYSRVLLVYTLPSFVAIPFTLLSGAIAGSRVRYKPFLTCATLLYIVSGLLPLALNSLRGILICRAFFGAAVGCIGPQGNALILRNFSGPERYRYMGFASSMIGLAGITFQLVGGWLCSIGWRWTFLGYALGAIPLLLIVTSMKDPPSLSREGDAHEQKPLSMLHLPPKVIGLCALLALMYVASQVKILAISYIVSSEGIGDSRTSALILSVATLGALPGGMLFSRFCKLVKDPWRLPILLVTLAISSATTVFCKSTAWITFGFFFGVSAFMMTLNLFILQASSYVPKESAGCVTAMVQCFEKIGVFASTYVLALVTAASIQVVGAPMYRLSAVFSGVVYLVIAAISPLSGRSKACKQDSSVQTP